MKTLYFEGAGWSDADVSKATIGNCRIRTAFHLDNGRAVYLEIKACEVHKNSPESLKCYKYAGFVDSCHYITDDVPNDDCNNDSIIRRNETTFEYNRENILRFVNSYGASFDAIEVVPDLGGYRVFPEKNAGRGTNNYNYGDEFIFDKSLTAMREKIYNHFYTLEKREGKQYPNFSLWVDENDRNLLHLLRHFNGYNKHWSIRSDTDNWEKTAQETELGRYGC